MKYEYDVSVIIPVYNMESFIEAGIKSLEAQTLKNFEIIMVDDGSKDKSGQICESIAAHMPNTRVIHTENRGSGPARNTGIANAKGEFSYFFDIDDSMEPFALEKMVSAARESKCDILVFAYTNKVETEENRRLNARDNALIDGAQARKNYDKYMEGPLCIQGAPWNKLFRTAHIVDNKIEYPDLRRNQDEVFIVRCVNSAKTIRIISDVLYHHLSNTRERMLLKYRLDYDENVVKLYKYFEMIISWNPENSNVKSILGKLYYLNMLDAMKVVFNPKLTLTIAQRWREVKKRHRMYLAGSARYAPPASIDVIKASNYRIFMLSRLNAPLFILLYLDTKRKLLKGE